MPRSPSSVPAPISSSKSVKMRGRSSGLRSASTRSRNFLRPIPASAAYVLPVFVRLHVQNQRDLCRHGRNIRASRPAPDAISTIFSLSPQLLWAPSTAAADLSEQQVESLAGHVVVDKADGRPATSSSIPSRSSNERFFHASRRANFSTCRRFGRTRKLSRRPFLSLRACSRSSEVPAATCPSLRHGCEAGRSRTVSAVAPCVAGSPAVGHRGDQRRASSARSGAWSKDSGA